jgi:hypothetical protein
MPPLPASPEDAPVSETAKLAAMLEPIVGSDGLIIDPEQREALSADI